MPLAFMPRYKDWKREFERYDITPHTILVGHSCGGGFLVRWLSEHPDIKVGKVVLVAPFLNPDNNPVSDTADFFRFEFDPNIADRTSGLTIMYSHDDFDSIIDSINIFREKLNNVKYFEFDGRGHFCTGDSGGKEFPELLQEIFA